MCLGLYRGVPLPERGSPGYTFVLPDQIIISSKSIWKVAPSDEAFRKKVKEVLLHERGHYFGFGGNPAPFALSKGVSCMYEKYWEKVTEVFQNDPAMFEHTKQVFAYVQKITDEFPLLKKEEKLLRLLLFSTM